MHATKFSRTNLSSFIVVSQKFKLKLISAKFLLNMISRDELSITLSTLWSNQACNSIQIAEQFSTIWNAEEKF